jgi:uncharacterized protein YbjT (DUF2867 family)
MSTIVVFGATGTIGRHVVETLKNRPGITVRPAVRKDSFSKLPQGNTIAPVPFDWDNDADYDAALKGADKVFLLTPVSEHSVAYGKKAVAAAQKAGVQHIVKLSVAGAEFEPGIALGRMHRDVEKAIEASGIAYTHLRPNCFADNWLSYWRPDATGTVYLPFGDGKAAYIDARDVGEAAAHVLATAGHENKAYVLSGEQALTASEALRALGEASGRSFRYVDVPADAARDAMLKQGAPVWMVDGFLELFALLKMGALGSTESHTRIALGKAPRSFLAFAKDAGSSLR